MSGPSSFESAGAAAPQGEWSLEGLWTALSRESEDPSILLERYRQDLFAGRLDEAQEGIERLLGTVAARPDPSEGRSAPELIEAAVLLLRGQLNKRRGHADGARGDFERVDELLDQADRSAWTGGTWRDLAVARCELGDLPGAREALQQAYDAGFRGLSLFRYGGRLALLDGDADTARNMLGRAAESVRRDPDLLTELAEAQAALGHHEKALEGLLAAGAILGEEHRLQEALERFETAVGLVPDHAQAVTLAGETRRLMGDPDGAEAAFNRALELDPRNPLALSRRADIFRTRGEDRAAEGDLDAVLAVRPDDSFALGTKGAILADRGERTEALPYLNRAIDLSPDYGFALARRGDLFRIERRFEEAEQDLRRALRVDPDNVVALGALGAVLVETQRPEEAEAILDQALEILPDYAFGLGQRAWARRALGRGEEALADAKRARALEPGHAGHSLTVAEILRSLDRSDEALAALDRAHEVDPSSGLYIYRRALLRRARGEAEEALADLERAREVDGGMAEVSDFHQSRALILEDLGRYREAIAAWDRSMALDPDNLTLPAMRGDSYRLLAGQIGLDTAEGGQALDRALEDLDRTLAAHPDHAFAHGVRGGVLVMLDRPEEGLEALERAMELDPDNRYARDQWIAALFRRGEALRVDRRLEEAERDLVRALELDDENVLAMGSLGAVYVDTQRPAEAEAVLSRALERVPDYAFGRNQRARARQALGRWDDALADAERAVAVEPENPSYSLLKAEILQALGRNDEALAVLDRAVDLNPDGAQAIYRRGLLRKARREPELALADLARAEELDPKGVQFSAFFQNRALLLEDLARYPEAIAAWDRSMALEPDNPRLVAMRGDSYRLLGIELGADTPEGAEALNQALTDLDHTLAAEPDYAFAQGVRGGVLVILGRPQEGLEALERAMELDPDNRYALDQRVSVLRRQDRGDEALAVLDAVLDRSPEDGNALRKKGELLRMLGRFEAALAPLRQALEVNPDDTIALGSLGSVTLELGRTEEAREALDRALDLDPDYAWGLRQRGELLRIEGDNEGALADLDRSLEIEPDSYFAHGTRGACLLALERFHEALEALDRALALDDGYGFAASIRGEALRMMGRLDEAEAQLESAIQMDGGDRFPWASLADIRRTRGRLGEAREACDRALELAGGDYPFARAVSGRIHFDAGDYGSASSALETALAQDATLVWARQLLGYCEMYLDRPDDAERSLRQAVEQDPDDPYGWMGLGRALGRQDRMQDASEAFQRVPEMIDPSREPPASELGLLGAALAELDRAREGMVVLADAIVADPDDPDLQLQLGRVTVSDQRYELGLEEYRQALDTARRMGFDEERLAGLRRQALLDLDETIRARRLPPSEVLDELRELLGANALNEVGPDRASPESDRAP